MAQEKEGIPLIVLKTEKDNRKRDRKRLVKSSWGVIGIFAAVVAIVLLIGAFAALAFNIGDNQTMLEFLVATAVCAGIATIALKQAE
ncbi:hypothetical protein ACFLVI_02480 [Chloroflexota bacterium]